MPAGNKLTVRVGSWHQVTYGIEPFESYWEAGEGVGPVGRAGLSMAMKVVCSSLTIAQCGRKRTGAQWSPWQSC